MAGKASKPSQWGQGAMISISQLAVTFGAGTPLETRALAGVDLTIGQGDFLAVIGSNGAGKSTLLGALAGEVPVTAGRIDINGRDVTGHSTPERAGLVARVFQDPLAGTCGPLTIEENLALAHRRGARRGLGLALKGRRELFRARLARLQLGIENRMGERMDRLSGGQRQAVSLLMATLAPREILLLDEHTAALDPRMADRVMDLTCQIVAEDGLTALMVTHSMRQALDSGNRTVMLHEGRVIFDAAGPERAKLSVDDLLEKFHRAGGSPVDDEKLLLG